MLNIYYLTYQNMFYSEFICPKYSTQYFMILGNFHYAHTFPLYLKIEMVTQFVWEPCEHKGHFNLDLHAK